MLIPGQCIFPDAAILPKPLWNLRSNLQMMLANGLSERLAKALIRLRVCAGWSEPLLVAHIILLEISCFGLSLFCIYDNECSGESANLL